MNGPLDRCLRLALAGAVLAASIGTAVSAAGAKRPVSGHRSVPAPGTTTRNRGAPSQLWSKFPLGKTRLAPLPRTGGLQRRSGRSEHRPPSPPGAGSSGSSVLLALLAVGLGTASLVALAVVLRFRLRPLGRAVASEEAEWDKYPTDSSQRRSVPVPAESKDRQSAAGQAASREEESVPSKDYGELGNRVARVLQAAEEAAEQIRAEARQAAAQIRREVEAAAGARRDELTKEHERRKAETESYVSDTRQAVESYATQQRRQAEDEAGKTLSEAEAQARATREAAEEMVKRIETAARKRQEDLGKEIRSLEARMERVVSGLRVIASQLEELLQAPPEGAQEESIVEALDVERRRMSSRQQSS